MRSHLLRVFAEAAIGEIDGDAARAERVAAELGFDPGSPRPAPDHAPRVRAVHAPIREPAGFAEGSPK